MSKQKLVSIQNGYPLSRRRFLALSAQWTAAILLGCNALPAQESGKSGAPVNITTSTQTDANLATKIGQMLIIGFRGFEVNQNDIIAQDIRDRHIGGVVLFDYDTIQRSAKRNIASPAQVQKLIAQLQSFAQIPLLTTVDYEGGQVNRLKEKFGFPATVSHQYLGQRDDLTLTAKHATTMAKTLANAGFNLNFAPVVDLDIEPNNPIIGKLARSFSADPARVTRHALEFINAHRQYGIQCTLKHFPGHGSAKQDSHLGLTDVTQSWSARELEPYQQLIQAGQVEAIMTAHVFNAKLDATYPATLSKPTISGLLREKLGYRGVIISDDIQMRAIASHYGLEVAVQKTIEAGVDMIIAGNNVGLFEPDIAMRIVTIIQRLVSNGVISESRIDESYHRIQNLKRTLRRGTAIGL